MVATHPPIECGVGTYAQYLADALRKQGNEVWTVSPFGAKGEWVIPCYATETMHVGMKIYSVVGRLTPDILHVQHEFGLYWPRPGMNFLDLYYRSNRAGLPVVTTLHTVAENLAADEAFVLREIVRESRAAVVHEDDHKKILAESYCDSGKVHVIPHGAREIDEIDGARKKIGVESKKVILICGYLRETKRYDRAVKVFQVVADAVEDAVLLIAFKSRTAERTAYQRELYRLVEESPVRDRIVLLHGQFPQHIFDTILSAADVVTLPYERGAQSGIMAHCFAFRKPVVTSGLKAFRNWVEESGGGLVAESDEELAAHLITILKDDDLRETLRRNIAKFVAEKISWRVVAGKHMDMYEKHTWRPTEHSTYFG
jgi:glycosyltransferase involved in cell wall biosynthesis